MLMLGVFFLMGGDAVETNGKGAGLMILGCISSLTHQSHVMPRLPAAEALCSV
jgi:hypothetical protein